jgi:uncharacterized protein
MPGHLTAKTAKISVFLITALCCLLLIFSPLQAMDVDYPDYVGYVNDFAGILDNASASDLEALITSIEENTGAEIAVVTIDTLEGITIEEYAVVLFELWGIGKAEEDNGLLILVALMERQVRIEVGYGLEGVITDLEAGRIIDEIIVPNFKNGDFSRGIYDAVVTVSNQIYGEEDPVLEDGSEDTSSNAARFHSSIPTGCWCCFPIFLFFALIIFLVNLFKRRCPQCRRFWALTIKTKIIKAATYTSSGSKLVERTCKYCSFHEKKTVTIPRRTRSSSLRSGGSSWSGGSSGGSFGGFGGGSSGGGGASGSW